MKLYDRRACALWILLSMSIWHGPAAATPDADSFAARCAPGLQTADSALPPDVIPGQRLQECREQYSAIVATSEEASVAQLAIVEPVTCPVTTHDIVVDNIADLRTTVATSAPGTVIGIDGLLDTGSDGGGDLIISSPGITATCAADGAGLTGFMTGVGLVSAQADNVTVSHLEIDALFGRGIFFGDFLDTGSFTANDGVAEYNRIGCTITCLFFYNVDGGLGRNNVLASGQKNFGLVALLGQNVTFADNVVSNCVVNCVNIQIHLNGAAVGNSVEQCGSSCIAGIDASSLSFADNVVRRCGFACISAVRSVGVSFVGNTLPGCNVPGTDATCLRFLEVTDGVMSDNEMQLAPGQFGASFAIGFFSNLNVEVRNNTFDGGFARWASPNRSSLPIIP